MKSVELSTWQRLAPAAALLILSPVMAEVMFGATHLTTFFLLLPQICIYGCAALIIREVVRRQQRNWFAILLLGMAYAVLEECVILQTSVSPVLFGGDPSHIYSWALGVNWIYLLWALMYESIWAIVLPIQLTELIFPDRRDEPWVTKRGLVIAAIVFLIASAAIWFRFTQVGIVPGIVYEAPLSLILIALISAAAFGAAAFTPWTLIRKKGASTWSVPRPWLVGLVAFGLSLPWFVLPVLIYEKPASLSAKIPFGIALAWAVGGLLLINRWAASRAWQESHRLSLIFGALLASMLAGFLDSGIRLPIDLIGKLVFNIIAVLMLIYLARRVHQRTMQIND